MLFLIIQCQQNIAAMQTNLKLLAFFHRRFLLNRTSKIRKLDLKSKTALKKHTGEGVETFNHSNDTK
jgi:hypothetical protein